MHSLLETLWQDVRFGARQLRRSPGFFAAAVATLALGIGANTAMFSVVYGVLLKPLPFADSSRLVGVWSTAPGIGWDRAVLAPAQYFTYREESRTFEDVALWAERAGSVTGDGEPERVRILAVTDGLLPLLRVQPALGRRFSREDDAPGAAPRVMLTHGWWQQHFGGDRRVVGRTVNLNGRLHEVIGVLPREFRFMDSEAALLVPFGFDRAATTIQDFSYSGIARLKPGATIEQANADVARMIALVPARFPASAALGPSWFRDARMGPDVHPLAEDAAGSAGRVLWVLMATIGFVLLIACANVANLFLVRADGRQQELAVRAALGAGRLRIARALLAETVTLGAAGGVVGIALAWVGVRLVRALAPSALPRVSEIGLNPVVLLFAGLLSVAAGLLFGLVPVARFAAPRLGALKDGGRTASDGRDRHRTRSALVVAEIALALVLLVASGLMIRTFFALRQVDPGFARGDQVLTLDLAIPRSVTADAEQVTRRHQEILQRLQQVPGVRSVGLSSAVPFSGNGMSNPMLLEDFPVPEGQVVRSRRMKWISPGYFETMQTRLAAGRAITWADIYGYAPVVMINERMARELWKTPRAAIGRRIRESARNPWREIVGVIRDERDDGLSQEVPPMVYYPCLVKSFWTAPVAAQWAITYVVRSERAGTPGFVQEVRQAIWSVARNLPLANVQTMEQAMTESMGETSFALVMLAIAATVSLVLGVIGIFGVVSYIAVQRTREIGIRVALGAQPREVTGLFLRHSLLLAAAGIGTGLAAAALLGQVMSSLLFGVEPTDPVTYAAGALVLGLAALVAGYLPSRRAARIDPMVALRSER